MLPLDFENDGYLPPGLHAAPLNEALARFGVVSDARQRQAELLRQVVEAARPYPTIKRILLWGSFVTTKPEPNDLDYSMVVSVAHKRAQIAEAHQCFFVPSVARLHYGAEQRYLVIPDYPLEVYVERADFLCHARSGKPVGIVEISLRGEIGENNS